MSMEPLAQPPAPAWEGRPVEEWRKAWELPGLVAYEEVTSTNDIARQLADAGAAAGTAVIADRQSLGRGQRGRSWIVPAGKGVLVSIVVRPDMTAGDKVPGVLPIRAGLAVAGAIEAVTGLVVGLKWPNDLLVDGCKIGGLLCEGVVAGKSFHGVIGVGINVLQVAEDFPPALDPPAASLLMLGVRVPRALIAGAVTGVVAKLGGGAARPLDAHELREYAARDILRGRPVTIDGTPAGLADGIAPDGALIVAGIAGNVLVRSGTVRPDSRLQNTTP